MSADNVAVVRGMHEHFGRADIPGVLPANFDEFAVVPFAFYDAGVGVVEGRATGGPRRVGVDRARQQAVRDVNDHDTAAWRDALGG